MKYTCIILFCVENMHIYVRSFLCYIKSGGKIIFPDTKYVTRTFACCKYPNCHCIFYLRKVTQVAPSPYQV